MFSISAGAASELVVLHSGYTLEVESYQIRDGILAAELAGGSIQIPSSEVQEIHPLEGSNQNATPGAVDKLLRAASVTPETVLRDAAAAQGIDYAFVRSVAKVESGLRPDAVSVKGARGLMQLMPGTAAGLRADANVMASNALGGATYLRQLLLAYKGDSALALAAYNAGPGAVKKYGGVPPFPETRRYILRVLKEYSRHDQTSSTKIASASR